MYRIVLPSPVKGAASQQVLAAKEAQLRDIAIAAGIELECNHAQMVLMDRENQRLRHKAFAKKKKKRTYTTGKARHMTGEEMLEELYQEELKKIWKDVRKELAPKFKTIKKSIRAHTVAEAKQRKKEAQQLKAALKKASVPNRGRSRGHGSGRARGSRGRGCGQGVAINSSGNESGSPDQSEGSELSDQEVDVRDSDNDLEKGSEKSGKAGETESEGDDDAAGETVVEMINGHHWIGSNLRFMVKWADGDVTWEKLHDMNDCAAMDDYLSVLDVLDPLLLPRRRYFIDSDLKVTQ